MTAEVAVIGAATPAGLATRLPLIAARARAAAVAGKRLRDFVRESGRDWTNAPCRLAVTTDSLADLEAKLSLVAGLLQRGEPVEGPGIHFGCVDVIVDAPSRPPAAVVAPAVGGTVAQTAMAIFCSLTGYETVDPAFDLAADLGIDSIKHAQVIETLWDRYRIPRDASLTIADYPTLGHMIALLETQSPVDADEPPAPPIEAASWLSTPEGRLDCATLREALAARPSLPREYLRAEEALAHAMRPDFEALGIRIAARELVARHSGEAIQGVRIHLDPDGSLLAIGDHAPLTAQRMAWTADADHVEVRMDGDPFLYLDEVRAAWRGVLGGEPAVAHVSAALASKFLRGLRLEDPTGFAAVCGGPAIYLTNHQTAIESFIFPLVAFALGGTLVEGVAMREHGIDWVEPLRALFGSHPDTPPSEVAYVVEWADPASVLRVLPQIERDLQAGGRSVCVAVEGMRERAARHILRNLSAAWIDLALAVPCPIVPVRFRGGLPLEDAGYAHDLPAGLGTQEVIVGRPIPPPELETIRGPDRRAYVLQALNALGPPANESPHAPDGPFAESVAAWSAYAGVPEIVAVLYRAVERYRPQPGLEIRDGVHTFDDPLEALVAAGRLGFALRQAVALDLPQTSDGVWLKGLAAVLFGSGGPQLSGAAPVTVRVREPGRTPR